MCIILNIKEANIFSSKPNLAKYIMVFRQKSMIKLLKPFFCGFIASFYDIFGLYLVIKVYITAKLKDYYHYIVL